MSRQYQYILFFLLLVAVYEVYLILFYKYKDFETNSYIEHVEEENRLIDRNIAEKSDHFRYIQTNAYVDRMAKGAQNLKNPGEETVFFVLPSEANDYQKLDTDKVILKNETTEKRTVSKTFGMSNWQKWMYYTIHVDLRE